jgi:hypothetical protein
MFVYLSHAIKSTANGKKDFGKIGIGGMRNRKGEGRMKPKG